MHLPREDDDRPPYIQAAEAIRRDITEGRLKPGDKLPSARALQDGYGVASSTVQNALRLLKSEGLIYSVQGRGSYVRQDAAGAEQAAPQRPGPDASDEYKQLAGQVQDLTRQVDQLTTLVQQLLDDRQS
ncbi:GntR family transcriptional regulator [Streptomyces lasiicapitis]|uniref:GntR family transcriptional regulator n=1 Tax=Streptomyces lasiicapitis TaxID=1923961 RepID=UPI00366224CE